MANLSEIKAAIQTRRNKMLLGMENFQKCVKEIKDDFEINIYDWNPFFGGNLGLVDNICKTLIFNFSKREDMMVIIDHYFPEGITKTDLMIYQESFGNLPYVKDGEIIKQDRKPDFESWIGIVCTIADNMGMEYEDSDIAKCNAEFFNKKSKEIMKKLKKELKVEKSIKVPELILD